MIEFGYVHDEQSNVSIYTCLECGAAVEDKELHKNWHSLKYALLDKILDCVENLDSSTNILLNDYRSRSN